MFLLKYENFEKENIWSGFFYELLSAEDSLCPRRCGSSVRVGGDTSVQGLVVEAVLSYRRAGGDAWFSVGQGFRTQLGREYEGPHTSCLGIWIFNLSRPLVFYLAFLLVMVFSTKDYVSLETRSGCYNQNSF